jgi:hypothetical protein
MHELLGILIGNLVDIFITDFRLCRAWPNFPNPASLLFKNKENKTWQPDNPF